MKAATFVYKKVIGSLLIDLQKEIFGMLVALENPGISVKRLDEMAQYCNETLELRLPDNFKNLDPQDKVRLLRENLNRPIRVCGMVKNEGEPGGGPFWVSDKNGKIS
ncbi:DUF4301 family protein, partial [Arthrospira platensis SPKY2]